jgi:hypothetical protein
VTDKHAMDGALLAAIDSHIDLFAVQAKRKKRHL